MSIKKIILKKCMNSVKSSNPNYSIEKLEEIQYGLEGIYLTITKIIIIFILAYFLNFMKETLFLMITYNGIRTTSFGLHATKSIYCLITSILLFIGGVYICEYIDLNIYFKVGIALVCLFSLYKYAPADTYKRPIINLRKRKIYKILSIIIGFLYLVLIYFFSANKVSNYLLVGMLEACIMILPLTYKLFNLPYDNYKSYVKQCV